MGIKNAYFDAKTPVARTICNLTHFKPENTVTEKAYLANRTHPWETQIDTWSQNDHFLTDSIGKHHENAEVKKSPKSETPPHAPIREYADFGSDAPEMDRGASVLSLKRPFKYHR